MGAAEPGAVDTVRRPQGPYPPPARSNAIAFDAAPPFPALHAGPIVVKGRTAAPGRAGDRERPCAAGDANRPAEPFAPALDEEIGHPMEYANLGAAYRSVCRRHADRILFCNPRITFGDCWRRTEALALFLRSEGYGRGDIIALLAGNSPEWCMAYMAVTAIGAVALPLDTNLPPEQYRAMLRTVEARAAFVSAPFSGIFTDVPVYAVEDEPPAAGGRELPELPLAEGDIASLLFTSGTTGNPKIVSLTHGNILHIALTCTQLEEYTEAEVTLAMLPLYHVYAFESTFMAPLVTGSSIVFQTSLKGPDIIRALAENPITIFPAAPQMWELFFDAMVGKIRAQSRLKYGIFRFFLKAAPLLRSLGLGFVPDRVFGPVHDLFGRHIRFFISGGAPLKKEYFEAYRSMGFHIMEGYGLTETTGPIAIPYYRDAVAGAVGPPIPGNEVRIKAVNADGIGEIWLKGPAVMAGYHRNDEANREAFDADGFFNTLDLGYVDARGHIRITGRKKNVVVLDSGKNVYPEELELHFRTSPLIAEISVFGRKIEGRETVCAVVVPAAGLQDGYRALREEIAELNRGLPPYKALVRFALSADPLPRNSTRKVLVEEVIRRLEGGLYQEEEGGAATPRNRLAPAGDREEEIAALLGERLQAAELLAGETLSDRGIDSLGLIELVVHLEERLGISVDMEKVSPFQRLEDFVRTLAASEGRAGANLDETILRGAVTTPLSTFLNPLAELILLAVRILSKRCWNLRVVHPERLVPDNAIIAANHQSNLDPVWLLSCLPWRQRRRLFLIGKKELSFLRWPLLGSPLLFVDRAGNVVPALKAASDVLRSGASLIIFPEGTRSRNGSRGRFKPGAAYLAWHLGRKLIPVTIEGSFAILPPGKAIPRFCGGLQGSLHVGEPLDPGRFASVEALNDGLREAIEKTKL
jgi:long-chain acyl-CoA synthetase